MPQVSLSPFAGVGAQLFDNNGVILTGGKLYTYAAGTTAPQVSYTSASGGTAHTNPIILDSAGRVPGGEIWLDDGLAYKFVVETSTSILIGTYDNITSNPVAFASVINFTGNGAQVDFNLGITVVSELVCDVFIDGVYQDKNTFSLAAEHIIFSEAPPINSEIEVIARQAFTTAPYTNSPITSSYASQETGVIKLGYGDDGAATIQIGSNNAFAGTGVLQVGGAGQFDSGNGAYIANDGHPNWNVLQSSIAFNPTEWNIYGNGVGGVAVSTGTTTLTRSSGRAWGSFMVGLFLWFDGIAYTVVSATANSAVLNSAPPAGTACWQFVYTTGSGTCAVFSGVVTRISGDPFIPNGFGSGFTFSLNGTAYTVTTSTDSNSCTISSPPANGNYSYSYLTNINNQVATLRLQLTAGADEENISLYATPFAYEFGAQQSGSGKLRNFRLNSEYQAVVELGAYGKFVSLGGVQNSEAMRVLWQTGAVNRFDVLGSAAGVGPSFRSRGADTNINIGYDTKGTGAHVFSSNSFAATNFKIFGTNQPDYLTVASGTGSAPIVAEGTSSNIDIQLTPKGTGAVRLGNSVRFGVNTASADAPINGYITIIDEAGNTRKLATIA